MSEIMTENKELFISALESALILYSQEHIASLRYKKTGSGLELAEIHFTDGNTVYQDITSDSCIAIMHDLWRALS